MPKQPAQDRIIRRTNAALLRVIDAFPDLLARCEPEAAATIVADIIKAQVLRPEPGEKMETLEETVARIASEDDEPCEQTGGVGSDRN